MRKTARPVVWEGDGAQSPSLDPIIYGIVLAAVMVTKISPVWRWIARGMLP